MIEAIRIYVEGGGDTVGQQTELRLGFDVLLREAKDAVRRKKLGWRLIPSGGRDQAAQAFLARWHQAVPAEMLVLLVDSEEAVAGELASGIDETLEDRCARRFSNADIRKAHLVKRDTSWRIKDIPSEHFHLMVHCMEAWIVADPEALASYYQKEFQAKYLPNRNNLEDEAKPQLHAKLKRATEKCQKGEYAKIAHASKLLGKIDPKKVTIRCPRFATLIEWLAEKIESA